MKKLLISIFGLTAGLFASAQAAPFTIPVTIGPVTLSADGALTDAIVRGTGAGPGVLGDLPGSPYQVGDSVDDFLDFDFETEATIHDDDFIELFFANTLVNGAGFDFVVFEVFNQSDPAGLVLEFMGIDVNDIIRIEATQIVAGADDPTNGRYAFDVDGDGTIDNNEGVFIYGFDLSDIGLAMGATLTQSIFLSAGDAGAADIAHVAGINFQTVPDIPIPAAAPLFLAGLAALRFARRRKRKV